MDDEDKIKRIPKCKPDLKKRVGRPKLRLIDEVVEDVRMLGVRNWWLAARDKEMLQECLARGRDPQWVVAPEVSFGHL